MDKNVTKTLTVLFTSGLLFSVSTSGMAQDTLQRFYLQVIPLDGEKEVFKKLAYETEFPDSLLIRHELSRVLHQLYDKGYLAATVDSLRSDRDSVRAYLKINQQYQWIRLHQGNVPEVLLSKAKYKERHYTGQPFHYKQVRQLQEQLLKYLENNGYPFAEVGLDSIVIKGDSITARLQMKKHQLVKIDSLALGGEEAVQRSYLYNYLGIYPGDVYNEERIERIGQRLNKLEFVQLAQSPSVTFYKKKAVVHLQLEKKQSSRLNGVIGVLPSDEGDKIFVTGEFELKLLNPFETGKLIHFNYRGLQNQTQDLQAQFNWPYFFRTPVGVDTRFNLYKKDTTYLDVQFELGLQYFFVGRDYVKGYVKRKSSSLLTVDTTQVKTSRQLPDNIDVQVTTYGLGAHFENLDYPINPTKGYEFDIQGGVGKKEIQKNETIVQLKDPASDFDYGQLYDSLDLVTAQYEVKYAFDWYVPLATRHVLKLASKGGGIWSEQLFQNELYRIGGIRDLRGFDEESIYASLYNILTLEYHYLLQKNAYFYVFSDGAYYQNRFQQFFEDFPFGFGTGITFETGAGIFTLSYALGRQQNNPIDLRTGKIHFGYINYF